MRFLFALILAGMAINSAQAASLTFDQAIEAALKNNPELRKAEGTVELARLDEKLLYALTDPAFTVTYGFAQDRSPTSTPQFTGTITDSTTFGFGVRKRWLTGTELALDLGSDWSSSDAQFRTVNPVTISKAGLTLSQPLLKNFWGRPDEITIEQLKRGLRAAEAGTDRIRQAVILQAAGSYLDAYAAGERVGIMEKFVADGRRLLAKQRERTRYGLAERSDVLQAEAALSLQELALKSARIQEKMAMKNLQSALSLPEGTTVTPSTSPGHVRVVEGAASFTAVKNRRPDLTAIRAQRESAELQVRLTEIANYPDLTLAGQLQYGGLGQDLRGSLSDMKTLTHPLSRVTLTYGMPFFKEQEKGQILQARARLQNILADEAVAIRNAAREYVLAQQSYQLARAQREASESLLVLQQKKYAAEENIYSQGRSSTDTLIRFQADVYNARLQLIQALADERKAIYELAFASGTLGDRRP